MAALFLSLKIRLLACLRRSFGVRLAVVYGGLFVFSIALILFLTVLRQSALLAETVKSWGESTAEQLAQSSLDAVASHNDIALQAQLWRLLKTPGVVSAALYDTQDAPLAQAGATQNELYGRAGLHCYSAALALGDKALGRAEVTLDTLRLEQAHGDMYGIVAGISVVALLFVFIASYRFGRQVEQRHKKLSQQVLDAMPAAVISAALGTKDAFSAAFPAKNVPLDSPSLAALLAALKAFIARLQQGTLPAASAARTPHLSGLACVYILLECRNLSVLQQQISRARLRQLLEKFQQSTDRVCEGYGVLREAAAGAALKIIFPLEDATQTAVVSLQAASCAYVLAGVLRDGIDYGISIDWRMALDCHTANHNEFLRNAQRSDDEQRSHWLCGQIQAGQFAFSAELAALSAQQEHIKLMDSNAADGRRFYRLMSFSEEHRRGLDQQIERLRAASPE